MTIQGEMPRKARKVVCMPNGNIEVTFGPMDVEAYNLDDYQRAIATGAIYVDHLPIRAFTGFDITPADFNRPEFRADAESKSSLVFWARHALDAMKRLIYRVERAL
jgi:hypothetical protein